MNINTNWKNINLDSYLKSLNWLQTNNIVGCNFLSYLNGSDVSIISEYERNYISNQWAFIAEDFLEYNLESNVLDVGGKQYLIEKDFNNLSFNQWQNIDELLKEGKSNIFKNIHLLLAITVQNRKDYTFENAKILADEILKEKMYYLIPAISFFLSKEQISYNNILSSLIEQKNTLIQEIWNIMRRWENLTTSGDGIGFYTKCRMKILQSMTKFWLKLYLKYLQY